MTPRHPWPDAPGAFVLPPLDAWASIEACLSPEMLSELQKIGVVGYQLHGGPFDRWVLYLRPSDRSAEHGPVVLCGRRPSGEFTFRRYHYGTQLSIGEEIVPLGGYGFAVALDTFRWTNLEYDPATGKFFARCADENT